MRIDSEANDTERPSPADSEPRPGLFADIPRPIWIAFLSAWGLLFGLCAMFFTTDGPATLAIVTAVFFVLMILGLPAALGAQTMGHEREFTGVIDTRTGPLGVGAAATQIVLIPFATAIGLIAFIVLAM
jgi:hypothetical protein